MGRMMLVILKAYIIINSINYNSCLLSTRVYVSACSFTYEFVMQLPVMLESVQSILAGFLVALLLGVTFASATLVTANDNLCVEER